MQRVVITGAGLISCIGNDLATVSESLQQGKSGLVFNPIYQEKGFKACVSGSIDDDNLDTSHIDRKLKRFLSKASLYAYLSALQAIEQAGLSLADIAHNTNIGVVAGSGGASSADVAAAVDAMREKGLRGVGAMAVPKTMASTVSASVATGLKIGGVSYSIASACATSTHCVGHAMELIQLGKQDIVIAGGGEQEDWTQSCMFDGMGAMSTQYNDKPQLASRPYDADRDGFVIAGGGGMVVVESLDSAKQRGATILAERCRAHRLHRGRPDRAGQRRDGRARRRGGLPEGPARPAHRRGQHLLDPEQHPPRQRRVGQPQGAQGSRHQRGPGRHGRLDRGHEEGPGLGRQDPAARRRHLDPGPALRDRAPGRPRPRRLQRALRRLHRVGRRRGQDRGRSLQGAPELRQHPLRR